jgi:hypothetical protein
MQVMFRLIKILLMEVKQMKKLLTLLIFLTLIKLLEIINKLITNSFLMTLKARNISHFIRLILIKILSRIITFMEACLLAISKIFIIIKIPRGLLIMEALILSNNSKLYLFIILFLFIISFSQ